MGVWGVWLGAAGTAPSPILCNLQPNSQVLCCHFTCIILDNVEINPGKELWITVSQMRKQVQRRVVA